MRAIKWYQRNSLKPKPYHHIFYTPNFGDAPIERHWGLAFIDHGPNKRRITDIARIADHAEYIVIHDTQIDDPTGELPSDYGYEKIWHLFKHRYDYTKLLPMTSVVSNFHELKL